MSDTETTETTETTEAEPRPTTEDRSSRGRRTPSHRAPGTRPRRPRPPRSGPSPRRIPVVTTPEPAGDDYTPEELVQAMEASLQEFHDGDIMEGVVVKIDRDEILLDIGYKSEGAIPSKELSIRHDVDPNEVVKVGDDGSRPWSCRRRTRRAG